MLAQVRPTGQYSVMSIPSQQTPPTPAGRPLHKRIKRQLWHRTPPFGALVRPKNYARFFALKGPLRKRYEEVLIADSLEALVSRQLGLPVRCCGHRFVGRNPKSGRSYGRYSLRLCDADQPPSAADSGKNAEIQLFVKRGEKVGRLAFEDYLSRQHSPHFHTPRFYGRFRANGTHFGVWEFIAGRKPRFSSTSREDTLRVVEAFAGVSALPYDEVVRTGTRVGTPWVEPAAERVEALVRACHPATIEKSEVMKQVESFAALEGRILARFDGLGHRYLAHNDAHSGNLILRPEDRRVVIVDWTSARLSAPGASLREIARWPESARDDVAANYVDWMSRFGHRLALADVLFVATGTMMFHSLALALSTRDLRQVRQALALGERLKSDA
jgi:hypothetical protein